MDLAIGGGMSGAGGIGGPGGLSGAGQAKPPVPEISGNDADRFNAVMNNEAVNSAQPSDSVVSRALDGLNELGAGIQADRAKAADLLGKPGVTQAELLGAQFAMMESANAIAAVSKVAEKITSAVKNLQQG